MAVARTVINAPDIIIADEPTGNLDPAPAELVLTPFERLVGAGKTLVPVTHEAEVAARAHRILRLHEGCVVEDRRAKAVGRSASLACWRLATRRGLASRLNRSRACFGQRHVAADQLHPVQLQVAVLRPHRAQELQRIAHHPQGRMQPGRTLPLGRIAIAIGEREL